MEFQSGNVVHIEIAAPDIPKLKAFYGALLGWTFQTSHDGYEFFDAGNIAGALAGHMVPGQVGTVITVLAEDVPAKLEQAAGLGGKVLQPATDVPGGGGIFGYFEDPCGNKVGVWMRKPGAE